MSAVVASAVNYGLPESALSEIIGLLRQYSQIEQVRLFGSRAKGNHRAASDIDICIDAPGLSVSRRLEIENRLDDLLLPWNIDLLTWHEIDNPELQEHINRVGIVLHSAGAK